MLRCILKTAGSVRSLQRGIATFRSDAVNNLSPRECWEALRQPHIIQSDKEVAAALDRISRKRLELFPGSPDQIGINDLFAAVREKSLVMRSRDLASVFASSARLRYFDPNFWFTISYRAKVIASEFDARAICRVLDALARSGNVDRMLVSKLVAAALPKSSDFTFVELAPMFTSLAKLQVTSKPLLVGLCANAQRHVDQMNALDIAWILGALAKLKVLDRHFIKLLCAQALLKIDEFDEKIIGVTISALASFELHDEPLIAQLCTRLHQYDVSPQNIANTLNALAQFKSKGTDRTVARLCSLALEKATKFNSQDISVTLNAMAQMQIYDRRLVETLCKQALSQTKFKPGDVQNVLRTLAMFQMQNQSEVARHYQDLVHHLCTAAMEISQSFNPHELSNTLKALASMQVKNTPLISQLCARALSQAAEFTAQEIGNTLRALGLLGVQDKDLVTRLCMEALGKVRMFNTQDIANTMDGLAVSNTYYPTLVSQLCLVSKNQLDKFTPGEIARMLNALMTFNVCDKALLDRFCALVFAKAPEFTVSHLAHILAALAHFNVYDAPLVTRLCLEALAQGDRLGAASSSDILQALADLNVYDEALIRRLCVRFSSYSPAGLAKALHSAAVFDLDDLPFISNLRAQIPTCAPHFTIAQTIRTLFALCSLGQEDAASVQALFDRLVVLKSNIVSEELAGRYAQCCLYISLRMPSISLPNIRSKPTMTSVDSAFQVQVSEVLAFLQIPHQCTYKLKSMSVDVALVESRTIIEFADTYHYFRHTRRIRGDVRFREQLISFLGWKFLRIPHFEWSDLDTFTLRESYLNIRFQDQDVHNQTANIVENNLQMCV